MTSLVINELITDMPPPYVDSRRNDRITGTLLLIGCRSITL
jgi:hypothetical protein